MHSESQLASLAWRQDLKKGVLPDLRIAGLVFFSLSIILACENFVSGLFAVAVAFTIPSMMF